MNEYKWHKWFAWYPVACFDNRFVWMTFVERKKEIIITGQNDYNGINYQWVYTRI